MLSHTTGCNQPNSECGKHHKTNDLVSSTNKLQILKRERDRSGHLYILKIFLLWNTYEFYGKSQYNLCDIGDKVLYVKMCEICL